MRMPVAASLLAAALSCSAGLVAQATTQTMLATDRHLFVIHGGVLHQFDVATLRLLHTHPLGAPAGGGLGAQVATQVGEFGQEITEIAENAEVVEMVDLAEPLLPPRAEASTAPPRDLAVSLDAALDWLARHQDDSGKWDSDQFMKHDRAGAPCAGPGNPVHDVGVTGLAVLAMLGQGSTLRAGPYQEHLKKAVQWLREQQQENGLIGANASHDFIYDHAIATYAMCEAFGRSDYQLLKSNAQRAINYLETHRNPYSVWRYQPRDNDNDTSVTTWAVCALVSGKSLGLEVNDNSLQLAATWYDQVASPDGRAGYTKAGESSSRKPGTHSRDFPVKNNETMTAAATFARYLLGQDPGSKPQLAASVQLLANRPPKWRAGHVDAIYWYFGTVAANQAGGRAWQSWQRALADLAANQCTEGNAAGSWDTVGVWDEDGGRVFVTALYALTLEAGVREARLVR